MSASWIKTSSRRASLFAGTALAALVAVSPLAASSAPGVSLSNLVVDRASALESHARDLVDMTRKQSDLDALQEQLAAFRAEVDELYRDVAAYDSAELTAEQKAGYALIKEKLRMLDLVASNKAALIDEGGWEHHRTLKAKAENLIKRAKLLAKAAERANLPAKAADSELL